MDGWIEIDREGEREKGEKEKERKREKEKQNFARHIPTLFSRFIKMV